MKLLILSSNLAENALGRAYVLWLLARELGWEATVAGPAPGQLWRPLANTTFAVEHVVPTSRGELPLRLARSADCLVAVKAWPASFGAALRLQKEVQRPVLLDLDEDDYAALLGSDADHVTRVLQWFNLTLKGRRPAGLRRLQTAISSVERTVSNPALQERLGGTVLPHVREDHGSGSPHSSRELTVAFVGTVRRHKGVGALRQAVAAGADRGHRLIVTAPPPQDAQPWESWVGSTSLEEGRRLVADADVICCLSSTRGYGPTQLPVKLIDGMLAGRAIVATPTPPIEWAAGGDGAIWADPADATGLAAALRQLEAPERRAELGSAARRRALRLFTSRAVAPAFAAAIASVTRRAA